MRWLASALVVLEAVSSASAQAKKEPLVHRVKASIERGVRYLKNAQENGGGWERGNADGNTRGGWTALAVLALLNSGVSADDPAMARGLAYLRGLNPTWTYVRALQTMALVEAGKPQDRRQIEDNVQWLIDARVLRNGQLSGWTYGKGPSASADNSNSQYAVLGLWSGRQGGVNVNRAICEGIRDYYLRTQEDDGTWIYTPRENLSFNLENGGLLFADACCGKETFDKAFRTFAKQLFPKEKLVQVPSEDMLFSKELNGAALTGANIECRTEIGGPMHKAPPYLEGIKIHERRVLLYSKYDIGCALERHQALDCPGYHPDSAFRIAGAAVLYALRP